MGIVGKPFVAFFGGANFNKRLADGCGDVEVSVKKYHCLKHLQQISND